MKQITTEIYDLSFNDAKTHKTISTISFDAYARAKYGPLLKTRYAAKKEVDTEIVLGIKFDVLKNSNI